VTRIDGVGFEQAYAHRKTLAVEGMQVPVISLDDLMVNKRASGRAQDLVDVARLEEELKRVPPPKDNSGS
jgi:hypothetical protein